MNFLPTGPIAEKALLDRYFEDMERWNFDVAYTAFYAFPLRDVIGSKKQSYLTFVREAHRRNMAACIQIQATGANPADVSFSAAQYYENNKRCSWICEPVDYTELFWASFASQEWQRFLQKITEIFIKEFGYDWIVYEEPLWKADIPGSMDPIYSLYKERYPEESYPDKREETSAYLKLQQLKEDVMVEFFDRLTAYGKGIGAKKVGLMPWFFAPTYENCPKETLHSSCNIARLIALRNVDFAVVRMQPDNIYAGTMLNTSGEATPALYYLEVLAHSIGKPVVAVNNPINEHLEWENFKAIPLEYFKKCTLAAVAAAPNGMTRHWYYYHDHVAEHMEFLTRTNAYINRLGHPESPIAFVYSYRGTVHVAPDNFVDVWKSYYTFAGELLYKRHIPFHTFYAGILKKCLTANPHVKVLILSSQFPLAAEEFETIRAWWGTRKGRAIIFFADDRSYSPDLNLPGKLRLSDCYSEIFEFFGVNESGVDAKSGAVTTERENGLGNVACFCRLPLRPDNGKLIGDKVVSLLGRLDIALPIVGCSEGILWNRTRNDYLIIANLGERTGYAEIALQDKLLWDVENHAIIRGEEFRARVDGLDFKIYRILSEKSKLLDVVNAVYLSDFFDDGNVTNISAFVRDRLTVRMRALPRRIVINGSQANCSTREIDGCYELIISAGFGEHTCQFFYR